MSTQKNKTASDAGLQAIAEACRVIERMANRPADEIVGELSRRGLLGRLKDTGVIEESVHSTPEVSRRTLAKVAGILGVHEMVWIDEQVGYDCGCNEHGTRGPWLTRTDALQHVAQALADSGVLTGQCTCPWVDPKYWTTHYGAIEPGSTQEYEPTCPVHGEMATVLDGHRPRPAEQWDTLTNLERSWHDEHDGFATLDRLLYATDGHHTMAELYEYRLLYNAALFNEWGKSGPLMNYFGEGSPPVSKSWKHSDGEPCFDGGWFIVVALLPTGQISNHYQAEHWDLFKVPEVDLPPAYDGHTPEQAAQRLRDYLKGDKA